MPPTSRPMNFDSILGLAVFKASVDYTAAEGQPQRFCSDPTTCPVLEQVCSMRRVVLGKAGFLSREWSLPLQLSLTSSGL